MSRDKNGAWTITLQPSGRQFRASAGSILRKVLFTRNTEMPCGGHGECRGCKVRMLAGATEPTDTERERFKAHELADGWRLACQTRVASNIELETRPWMEPCIRPEPTSHFPRGIAGLTFAFLIYSGLRKIFRKRG